jgi:hypothetical protein
LAAASSLCRAIAVVSSARNGPFGPWPLRALPDQLGGSESRRSRDDQQSGTHLCMRMFDACRRPEPAVFLLQASSRPRAHSPNIKVVRRVAAIGQRAAAASAPGGDPSSAAPVPAVGGPGLARNSCGRIVCSERYGTADERPRKLAGSCVHAVGSHSPSANRMKRRSLHRSEALPSFRVAHALVTISIHFQCRTTTQGPHRDINWPQIMHAR